MLVETYAAGNIEKSEGFEFTTLDFGVKSPALIFDILCNRMYQKPLQTMIQEYMCNARDAHREIGNDATPVEVTLPTSLDPYIRIRDFGPGLTEERINEVFVFLGESTKRSDNMQTGGFGIGAKVGWAYSDSFTIHSTVDNVCRTYLAFLGDTHVGKLSKMGEVFTEDPNGVEIQIRINDDDYYETENALQLITYFWEVQPIVHNRKWTDQKFFEGTRTALAMTSVPTMRGSEYLAIVDGIPYTIDMNSVTSKKFYLPHGVSKNVCLFFGIGELDLAVNREGLRYSPKTIEAIDRQLAGIHTQEAARKVTVDFAFTIEEKQAAMKDYFSGAFSLQNIKTELIPGVVTMHCGWNDAHNPKIRIKSPNSIKSSAGIPSTAYYITQYDMETTSENLSGIACRSVGTSHRDGFGHTSAATYYIWKGVGAPSKEKARTVFEHKHVSSIKVFAVTDDYTYNQLTSIGYPSLNDVADTIIDKKAVKETRPVIANTKLRGISNRYEEGIDISEADPTKHCYCLYKEREEARNHITRVCGNAYGLLKACGYEIYYATQEQLANMRYIPHYKLILGKVGLRIRSNAHAKASITSNLSDIREGIRSATYGKKCDGATYLFDFFTEEGLYDSEIEQLVLFGKQVSYYESLLNSLPGRSSSYEVKGRGYQYKYAEKRLVEYRSHIVAAARELSQKYPLAAFVSTSGKKSFKDFAIYVKAVQETSSIQQ